MAASDHKRGSSRGKFCGVPGCDHNDYQKVCKPTWSSLRYPQTQFSKTLLKTFVVRRSYEAHHLLCVSQVGKVIVDGTEKSGLKSIIDETDWCINAKVNMLAMPMWGHTIMWYCDGFKGIVPSTLPSVGSVLTDRLQAPPFKDLPQHNYGHAGRDVATSYNKEVEERLQRVVNAIEKSKLDHKEKADKLESLLDSMADFMRTSLKNRGLRSGGTHTCWMESSPQWYAPFSMAQTPRPIPHPKDLGEEMIQKIKKLAEALWKLNG
jgi:hypothetical protein